MTEMNYSLPGSIDATHIRADDPPEWAAIRAAVDTPAGRDQMARLRHLESTLEGFLSLFPGGHYALLEYITLREDRARHLADAALTIGRKGRTAGD